jgi:hypothetical protein
VQDPRLGAETLPVLDEGRRSTTKKDAKRVGLGQGNRRGQGRCFLLPNDDQLQPEKKTLSQSQLQALARSSCNTMAREPERACIERGKDVSIQWFRVFSN